MIYVDITNVLRTAFSIPTGIPRVEHAIARYFLSSPEEARAIYFRADDWFVIPDDRASDLRALLQGANPLVGEPGYWARLRWGFGAIAGALRPLDKELHRAVASQVTGDQREGRRYALHKMLFRIVGLSASLAAAPGSGRLSRQLAEGDRLLVSSVTVMNAPKRALADPYGRHSFVIMYDTTPLDHPDMTTRKIAARFPLAFRSTMEHAAAAICISQFTRDRSLLWASRLGVGAPPPHYVFRMSSPLVETMPEPEPLPAAIDRPFVLFCATIEPRKNHLLLLRVWLRLLDAVPENLPLLVLVGKVGWKSEATLAFIDRNPALRENVLLISDGDDHLLASLYSHASFTVFPSIAEGWGLGASESLDFGTPVVTSTCGALIEATEGLMPSIDAFDEEGWFRMLLRLLTDENSLAQLREKIGGRYHHRAMDEGMADIRAILLSERPSGAAA